MRKGKGELTYAQLKKDHQRIYAALIKARRELHAMTVAHNKLLASRTLEKGE